MHSDGLEHGQDLLLAPQFQLRRVFEHGFDHHWGHVVHESPFDFFAFPLLSDILIQGQNRIIRRKNQQGIDDIEPQPSIDEKPTGNEEVQEDQARGEQKPFEGAQAREGDPNQHS